MRSFGRLVTELKVEKSHPKSWMLVTLALALTQAGAEQPHEAPPPAPPTMPPPSPSTPQPVPRCTDAPNPFAHKLQYA